MQTSPLDCGEKDGTDFDGQKNLLDFKIYLLTSLRGLSLYYLYKMELP